MSTNAGKLLWYVPANSATVNNLTGISRYPISYTFIILPLSVVRWIHFTHPNLNPEGWLGPASLTVDYIFNLSGVITATLFVLTRPRMFGWEKILAEELDPKGVSIE
jgi:hypothetical protein